jgi:hypothetical protein
MAGFMCGEILGHNVQKQYSQMCLLVVFVQFLCVFTQHQNKKWYREIFFWLLSEHSQITFNVCLCSDTIQGQPITTRHLGKVFWNSWCMKKQTLVGRMLKAKQGRPSNCHVRIKQNVKPLITDRKKEVCCLCSPPKANPAVLVAEEGNI